MAIRFFTHATWVLLCVPLSASVTSRSSIETDERIELGFFGTGASSTHLLLCKREIRLSLK